MRGLNAVRLQKAFPQDVSFFIKFSDTFCPDDAAGAKLKYKIDKYVQSLYC